MHKGVAKRRGRESSKSSAHSKKSKRVDTVADVDEMRTTEINTCLKKSKKRKVVSNLKSHKSKKRRTTSDDRVPLLHSDSDSSLSDEGEKGSGGNCEDSESGGDGEEVDVGEGGNCDGEEVGGEMSEKVASKKKRNKKMLSRVRVGKHWVKAGSGQSSNGQKVSVLTGGEKEGKGEKGGEGATGKTKRRMDEEKRKKIIEHRRLRRQRKKVCFSCRQPGHWVGDCPLNSTSSGICFKCGSSEHSCQKCHVKVPPGEFPYAKCFICGETGHLSRSCPDNPRGLYPRGGGCKICGSVEHLKANCPIERKPSSKQSGVSGGEAVYKTDVFTSADALDITEATAPPVKRTRLKTGSRKGKLVKF